MIRKILILIILFFLNINTLFAETINKDLGLDTEKIMLKYLPSYEIVGKANYSFIIWNIYDATLITKTGELNNSEFILVLKYNKVIKKDRLINETINEFKKQANFKEEYLIEVREILEKTFKETKVNSVFIGIKNIDKSFFYFDGLKILETEDQKFINHFFNIWLREDSQNPSFTKKLTGKE
ncbi:MAG: hypothetical protein ISQ39_00035 [Alphaproteobacteria bacterium]|nr:hypothetical protein [Alphaproteobacteria bacterium]